MNVLIIGNGFDRKIGLKTDFLSFIDWMKKRGYGVGDRFRKQSEKINFPFITHPGQTRIDNYTKFKGVHIQYAGEIFTIRNWTVDKNLDESTESRLSNDLLYLLPEITGNETLSKTSQPNIWYCFIQLLLFQSKTNLLDISASEFTQYINTNGNWVDLEGLIQKSIEVRVTQDHFRDGIFSITNHFDVFSLANLLLLDIKDHRQKAKGEIYKAVWLDFLEFKKALSNYLSFASNKCEQFWSSYEAACTTVHNVTKNHNFIDFSSYSTIINFNYTNFLPAYLNTYYVHGNIDDFDKIVFGLDMNIKGGEFQTDERKTKFEISLHKNKQLLKFSKISQLLHLQVDKTSVPLNIISTLSIIGHGIGEQDYSYFFSILDRNADSIQINCFWYKFNEEGDNKESTKEALFEMLTSYEKYSNQRILHKMIFEGRIKFKEVFIPNIYH